MTEQEKGEWTNPWPDDGDQCPDCHHGQLEVQSFGQGEGLEIYAWCGGLNGTRQEDAEEDDESCGCGWCGNYQPNRK